MNSQSDQEQTARIVGLLNQDVCELDPAITAKLLSARKEALAHYVDRRAPAWVPEWAGASVARFTEPHYLYNARMFAVTVVLVSILAYALVWQPLRQGQGSSEVANLDAGLLADNLPIDAYLDRGFDSWLKRHSR